MAGLGAVKTREFPSGSVTVRIAALAGSEGSNSTLFEVGGCFGEAWDREIDKRGGGGVGLEENLLVLAAGDQENVVGVPGTEGKASLVV